MGLSTATQRALAYAMGGNGTAEAAEIGTALGNFAFPVNGYTAFATGGQASATQLDYGVSRITTCATAGDSVKLPLATAGASCIVINRGASAVDVFPQTGEAIDAFAANAALRQFAGSMQTFVCAVAGTWNTANPLALNAITAFAGGGQGSATLLTQAINRVTVCATLGDSVKLPLAAVNQGITVINRGATGLDIFPFTGDAIDGLAANTAVRISSGASVTFYCAVAGTWNTPRFSPVEAKYGTVATAGPATAGAGEMTGAGFVVAEYTNIGANNLTTRTATQMFAESPDFKVGDSYVLVVRNVNAGQITIVAGGGVTLTGTATIAANTERIYIITFTSATALVMQNVMGGIAA